MFRVADTGRCYYYCCSTVVVVVNGALLMWAYRFSLCEFTDSAPAPRCQGFQGLGFFRECWEGEGGGCTAASKDEKMKLHATLQAMYLLFWR